MDYVIGFLLGVAFAAGWCVARLQGDETLPDTLRRIVPFSGGPRPGKPR